MPRYISPQADLVLVNHILGPSMPLLKLHLQAKLPSPNSDPNPDPDPDPDLDPNPNPNPNPNPCLQVQLEQGHARPEDVVDKHEVRLG